MPTPTPPSNEEMIQKLLKDLEDVIAIDDRDDEMTWAETCKVGALKFQGMRALVAYLRRLEKEHGEMRTALEYVKDACLCERFKTKGFDYGQSHPVLGKAGAGQRWWTPPDEASATLSSITLKP